MLLALLVLAAGCNSSDSDGVVIDHPEYGRIHARDLAVVGDVEEVTAAVAEFDGKIFYSFSLHTSPVTYVLAAFPVDGFDELEAISAALTKRGLEVSWVRTCPLSECLEGG